jgi:nicotinamide mononucleotide transporter
MRWTNSTVPMTDALTTALSIVALWMMARKYAEQWLVWLLVDAICVPLYAYKGIYFYAGLYAVYTVIAWFGYRKWLRLMREGK